ncbi:MAG: hypothetical protein OXC95_14435 [Dehalococcoidia bacterium]|nr:hypothetical protein [Dehalococcoidia bacterium]
MIMKAIRTSVFIGAILLGVAASATVSAWSVEYTGRHETAILPDNIAIWDQRAWVFWRNHTESSVQLNWTSHRMKYVSGYNDSASFTAHNRVINTKSQEYFDDDVGAFELDIGESWYDLWEYGGGTSNNQYITVSKANDSAKAIMTTRFSSPNSLTQEIWFINDDDDDPAICMERSTGGFQTITGPATDCP